MKGTDTQQSRSAAVRTRLSHPIIDSDGHTAEFELAVFDYLRDIGGSQAVERFKAAPDVPFSFQWYRLSWQERRERRVFRPHWFVEAGSKLRILQIYKAYSPCILCFDKLSTNGYHMRFQALTRSP